MTNAAACTVHDKQKRAVTQRRGLEQLTSVIKHMTYVPMLNTSTSCRQDAVKVSKKRKK